MDVGHGRAGSRSWWAAVPGWASQAPAPAGFGGTGWLYLALRRCSPEGGFTRSQLSAGKLPASAAALSERAGYRLSCAHVKHVCHFSPNAVPGAPIFKRALLHLRGEALPLCHRLRRSGDFPGAMLMKSPDFHHSVQPCCSSSCSHQELSSARCFSRNNLFIQV